MPITSATAVRVAVVEDQPLYRSMLESALAAEPTLHVVAAVGTASEALRILTPGVADVLVLDIELPDDNGIALGVTLCRAQPRLGVVLLSAHDMLHLLTGLPRDIPATWSYLSKSTSTTTTTLVRAILAAARGQQMLDPELVSRMAPRARSSITRLTDRQLAVLRLLAQGLSNAAIGAELGITEKSVQNHVNAVYATLGIDADRKHNPRVVATLRLIEETARA